MARDQEEQRKSKQKKNKNTLVVVAKLSKNKTNDTNGSNSKCSNTLKMKNGSQTKQMEIKTKHYILILRKAYSRGNINIYFLVCMPSDISYVLMPLRRSYY